MSRLSKKALLAFVGIGVVFSSFAVIAIIIGDWTSLLLGVLVVTVGVAIIEGQRRHRQAVLRLATRISTLESKLRELDDVLAVVASHARFVADRPSREIASGERTAADWAARFNWLERRQAEILRELRAASGDGA